MLIEKYDESYVRISFLEDREKISIDDKFSVFEKNFFHNKAYKIGKWDGKKHFFDIKYNILPLGLVPDLEAHFKENKKFFPKTKIEKDYEEEVFNYDFTDFYSNLNLAKHIEIRDYQQKGFEDAINKRKCILKAATGAGKSLILWLLVKYLAEDLDNDVLIIVPQTQLVEQLYSDFEGYGSFKDGIEIGRSTEKKLGKRDAKKLGLDWEKLSEENRLILGLEKKIVISTWQTLQHKPKSYFKRFKSVLMDEVHNIDGETIQKVINFCTDAKWKVGMSGTLKPDDKSQLTYTSFFQNQSILITPRELIDRGYATEVDIYPVILQYVGKSNYKNYQDEIDYISFNEERLEFIYNLAKGLYNKSENNNTLILFKSVEKGFWRELKQKLKFVENLFIVHGETPLEEREMARKIADEKNNVIIIASFSTFSTGVNVKNLHNIIFTESYQSMVKIAQSIGRGMRQHSTKKIVKIFDIIDRFDQKNMVYKQYLERKKIYKELEFKVKNEVNYIIKNI